tara:strand:- start:95 stop:289 length:195 start_codon:yes stop_codon:yes gene_type:complete
MSIANDHAIILNKVLLNFLVGYIQIMGNRDNKIIINSFRGIIVSYNVVIYIIRPIIAPDIGNIQ